MEEEVAVRRRDGSVLPLSFPSHNVHLVIAPRQEIEQSTYRTGRVASPRTPAAMSSAAERVRKSGQLEREGGNKRAGCSLPACEYPKPSLFVWPTKLHGHVRNDERCVEGSAGKCKGVAYAAARMKVSKAQRAKRLYKMVRARERIAIAR